MSKFIEGDRVEHIDSGSAGIIKGVSGSDYSIIWDKYGQMTHSITVADKNWTKIQSHKNQVIDQMNAENDKVLSIAAEVDWIPMDANESPPITCSHTWRTVTLFISIVEECSKCGKLRE